MYKTMVRVDKLNNKQKFFKYNKVEFSETTPLRNHLTAIGHIS